MIAEIVVTPNLHESADRPKGPGRAGLPSTRSQRQPGHDSRSSTGPRGRHEVNRSLRSRPDGSFTLVQFTDTHFEDGCVADQRTQALMERVLDLERPDLVVLTGDVIGGSGAKDPPFAWWMAAEPMVARGLPWAAIFGNHDEECGLPRRKLLAIQQAIPGCLTIPGPARVSGVGNYLVRIAPRKGAGTRFVLCFVDTNSYAETDIGGHGWVREDQIRWFRQTLGRLSTPCAPDPPPALVFIHIPLPEYDEVWRLGLCQGEKREPVCCPRINTGLFATLHLAGNVRGVFAGHDHLNDYEGRLHGIRLCYGRATGYNTYGEEDFRHGARIIRLQEGEPDFTTWIRLDDGTRVDYPSPSGG